MSRIASWFVLPYGRQCPNSGPFLGQRNDVAGDRFSPAAYFDRRRAGRGSRMTKIIHFPIERTQAAAAERAGSRRMDAAIMHAEQWHRIHRASKQLTLDVEPFQRDQESL